MDGFCLSKYSYHIPLHVLWATTSHTRRLSSNFMPTIFIHQLLLLSLFGIFFSSLPILFFSGLRSSLLFKIYLFQCCFDDRNLFSRGRGLEKYQMIRTTCGFRKTTKTKNFYHSGGYAAQFALAPWNIPIICYIGKLNNLCLWTSRPEWSEGKFSAWDYLLLNFWKIHRLTSHWVLMVFILLMAHLVNCPGWCILSLKWVETQKHLCCLLKI